ncbi:DUF4595 domain-containing protein [Alistipes onderdonkii]|uniref:DUF4595 domain-containing protein n=1 Tax=Alistipes onderdonkii TaxID=328813 RepID=UPI0018AC5779|nr:DUF4595 domain-containing protein [Alistipes onderdonkii]
MKKLFLIVAALFVAVSFSACSDDDENEGGSNTSIVSQIIQQDEDGETLVWKFDYDNQGRIAKISSDDFTTLFSYTVGEVEITERYDGEDYVYSATLNGQGYIATLNDIDGNTSNYSYDKNGYLSKLTWGDDGELQCTWNNGDLINEHRTGSDPMNYNYEYTNYPAKQNIDIFAFVYGYCHVDDPEYLGVGDLLGKKSTHLIKSSTSQAEAHVSFSYELDANGNPTKVTMSSEYETITYKILYE